MFVTVWLFDLGMHDNIGRTMVSDNKNLRIESSADIKVYADVPRRESIRETQTPV